MSTDQVTSADAHSGPRGRRMLRTIVAGVAVGAVMLGSVASVGAHRDDGHKLTVIFHGTSYTSTQADPNSSIFVPGDELYGGATVLRFKSPHDQIGIGSIHCDATGAEGSSLTCEANFILPLGKITTQTLFDIQNDWLQPTRKLAITGGTGAYRHASGELTVTTQASGDEVGVFDFGD